MNQTNNLLQESNNQKLNLFKQYLFFWGGQLFSLLGSSIVSFVLILWISFETSSELMLGLASIVSFGPFLIIGPFAGVITDRLNRKMIIISADAAIAITTLAAIMLFYTGYMNLIWFFLIIAIRGIGDVFHYTTVNAMMPTMVPQKHLSRMNGINFLSNGVIRIIGPVIAAALLGIWPTQPGHLLWADIITFGIALVPIIFITIPAVSSTLQKGEKISFFKDFKEIIMSIKRIKGMIGFMFMFMIVNFFFTPFSTLLPLFVVKTHAGTEASYAIVVAFLQAGTVIGGLFMTFFKGFKKKALSSYIALVWAFVVLCTLYLVPVGAYWVIGFIMFLVTLALPVINVSVITAFQTIIPKEKLGRTMSVFGTMSSAIQPIAMLLSGVIGEYTAIPIVFLSSGLIGLFLCSAIWFLTKAPKVDDVIGIATEDQLLQPMETLPETIDS